MPLAILEKRPLRNFDLREHDEAIEPVAHELIAERGEAVGEIGPDRRGRRAGEEPTP